MTTYVLDFHEIDRARLPLVGGKGAQLGELSRIDGVPVPAGFCVTTAAFRRVLRETPAIDERLERLSRLLPDDRAAIRTASAAIRDLLAEAAIPHDVATAVMRALDRLGAHAAYAVRSSATAEDLPTASFAGQHDSFLNLSGPVEVLRHVAHCWASLFTERAVTYRLRNGIDHRDVQMAVVVQRMVFAQAAGVLFTADPVNGNRKVASVEACFGLGEALVAGRVNADVWKVRDDTIVASVIANKTLALDASPAGGTQERAIETELQAHPALTDAQVLQLAQLGRRIEMHYGCPQDIEWCLAGGEFHIVQSRPVTTLFPIPAADDAEHRVYLSVGHQQMMTEAMRPLGLSLKQHIAKVRMHEAGSRLFVEVTGSLATEAGRAGLMRMAGRSDPLTGDALRNLIARGFVQPQPEPDATAGAAPAPIDTDPAIVDALVARTDASIAAVKRDIRGKSGPALVDFILADIEEMKRLLFDPLNLMAIMASVEATWWLNEQLYAWLGEKNAADVLARSVHGNVTSEMGLALLDVADVIRRHPAVVAFLQRVQGDDFLDALAGVEGGHEAREAIVHWLDRYGMRCAGEIDITNPRWSEHPSALLPVLLGNVRNFEPGAGARRFEQGRQEAAAHERALLERLRALPDGAQKAAEMQRKIDRVRTFAGYREYPKYGMVSRYFVYKQALLEEAARLVEAGVLRERDDIAYLTLHELREVARTHEIDSGLIERRKETFRRHQVLTPPRVLTSEGESVAGVYRREDLPHGAMAGIAVSAGIVEGRARVVVDMDEAQFEAGDILVTAHTDPSWTPLFVAVKGLVTEVGGVMTHGAVIAREYGLPAVVGVENATRLIRDGQRIRVNGTEGHVEILADSALPAGE